MDAQVRAILLEWLNGLITDHEAISKLVLLMDMVK